MAKKPRILVVEDSHILAKVIQKQLSTRFEVEMALDGDAALAFFKSGKRCEALLLDLVLPKVDGFQILHFLRQEGITCRTVVMTSKPRMTVEKDLGALGVRDILVKPLDYSLLENLLQAGIADLEEDVAGDIPVNPRTGKKYPLKRVSRFCHICGYENVTSFLPIAEGLFEDWSMGAYPQYCSLNGYEPWDALKTWVTVCPYCFFASADPHDFSSHKEKAYPYTEDSKKILARTMGFRKKMAPEALDIDPRFSLQERSRENVILSLQLAEKCSNGLILGEKRGAYCQAGIYATLLGAVLHPDSERHFREAYASFENQLKHKDVTRPILVRTYYFCIVLHMLLGRTILGRDIMKKVEKIYQDKRVEDLEDEEREWLIRINTVWKNGVYMERSREI